MSCPGCENPESGLSFRIDEDPAIRKIMKDILLNHVLKAANKDQGRFYRSIVSRIREGFRLEVSTKNTIRSSTRKTQHTWRRGRGLR